MAEHNILFYLKNNERNILKLESRASLLLLLQKLIYYLNDYLFFRVTSIRIRLYHVIDQITRKKLENEFFVFHSEHMISQLKNLLP